MKRPTHVWCVFVFGLAVAIAGMAWLSLRVTELESAEATRNHEADFEARVRLALRRMDSFVSQMLSDQSAWHYVFYQPTVTLPGSGKEVPSPLRVSNSPLVKLYFQVTPDMAYTSPGVPRPAHIKPLCLSGLRRGSQRSSRRFAFCRGCFLSAGDASVA